MPACSCGCNSSTAALCDDLIEVKSRIDVRGLHYQVSRGYHSRNPAGLTFFFSPPGVKTQLLTVLPRCEAQQHVAQRDRARRLQVGSSKAVGACSAPSGPQPTCGTWWAPLVTYTKPNCPQPCGDSPLHLNSAPVPWYRVTTAEGSLYVNIWCSLVCL